MIALAAAALVVLSGCGGGSGTPSADAAPADPSSVSVTETAAADLTDETPLATTEKKKKAKAAAPAPAKTTATPKPSPKPSRSAKPQPPKAVKPKVTPKPVKPKAPVAAPAKGMTAIELEVLRLTNAERAKAGCSALRGDAKLALAARRHSTDMGVNGYFDHDSQDGSSPFDRMKKAGYTSPGGAENIAAGQPTAAAVMDGWMKSPGHKANILNCKLKALGVGYYKGTKGYRTYWTQDFGFA
jgi:uncharacterized protein YkwD